MTSYAGKRSYDKETDLITGSERSGERMAIICSPVCSREREGATNSSLSGKSKLWLGTNTSKYVIF